MISGVIEIETPSLGFVVPLAGLLLIGLSFPTGRGEGPLANWFPNEDNAAMGARVEADLTQGKHETDVGNAWAKLEHSMLSKELEAEE